MRFLAFVCRSPFRSQGWADVDGVRRLGPDGVGEPGGGHHADGFPGLRCGVVLGGGHLHPERHHRPVHVPQRDPGGLRAGGLPPEPHEL